MVTHQTERTAPDEKTTKAKRRPRGTGSVVEIRDGVHRVRIFVETDILTGKPRQIERIVRGNKSKAEAKRKELEKQVDAGQHSGVPNTLAQLIEEYAKHAEARGRAPRTIDETRRVAEKVIPAEIGAIPITKLTTRHLDELYRRLVTGEGVSVKKQAPASIQRHHAVITAALSQAVVWKWISSNPAEDAKFADIEQTTLPVLTPTQVRTLLAGAAEFREEYGMLALLAILTASRLSEFCALRWKHINWDEELITIERTLFRSKEKRGEKITKGKRARTIALTPTVAAILGWWRIRCEKRAADIGVELVPDAFIVSGPRSPTGHQPVNPETFSAFMSRLANKNGWRMSDYGRNPFRHVGGTKILRETNDARSGADLFGHADPAFFIRRYTHGTTPGQLAAAEALGSELGEINIEAGDLTGLLGLEEPQ